MAERELSSSEEDQEDQEEDQEEETVQDRYAKIRNEVSEMSIEELLLLKEQLGTKAYNEVMFPSASKTSTAGSSRTQFQRENKNRPAEVSSKVRTSQLRTVVPVKKKVIRDPRFDDLSGNYNETYFNQAYGFLSDVKEREKGKLLKTAQHEKDPVKRRKIDKLLLSMAQKEKSERAEEEKKKREKERKRTERELVAKGKKPFFLKKSEKKRLELEAKHAQLQESGQMDKYLKIQSKKKLQKERKTLSFL